MLYTTYGTFSFHSTTVASIIETFYYIQSIVNPFNDTFTFSKLTT